MKQLVILNPVIENLLGDNYLDTVVMLGKRRLKVVGLELDIVKKEVKEMYKSWLEKTPGLPVIDSRCPAIRETIKKEFPNLRHLLAPILPILITGAEMRRAEFGAAELVVVTPCQAFASFKRADRQMVTWQEFRACHGINIQGNSPAESPVPLGFFNTLGVQVTSASGEENCRKLLTNIPKDATLLELLFCEGGCHRGDGL